MYTKELKDLMANATLLGFFLFHFDVAPSTLYDNTIFGFGFAACLQWRRDVEDCVQNRGR
jgi:hypothetical protein